MNSDYRIQLEIFEGPLDLLLYLIRKNDLEIAEIPISQITTEYLECLQVMQELNLEIAGEFLVMAATLMQIKARMLLPSAEEEKDDGPDPLEELKAKLAEYQRFKEVAHTLADREEFFAESFDECKSFDCGLSVCDFKAGAGNFFFFWRQRANY